ncbi:hypothetical protein DYD21_03485 [Rhodohalobacter sp. SW132]|uniref:hypothetical protein n=1 Tax=Rhodohalobacter sp. SW132 TaxID=2293433 RepID=UPI000E260AA6|nr:hypothetical protein [Rhodohalobacter sp. SW132]REL39031.1 hypothetical protein DYD21_03485 [Rhodohalobacter sp. SW132]
MKKTVLFMLLLSLPFILAQCNHSQDEERDHMMDNQQVGQMMNNPEQRQAMTTQMMQNREHRQEMMRQMAEDTEMRHEFMNQMHSSMMNENHDMMLDRVETMMNDPEQREQMKTHMQQMLAMMENEEFDREQMRVMMEQSPVMGKQMNCMQMMRDM